MRGEVPSTTVFGAELEGDEVFFSRVALEIADCFLLGNILFLYHIKSTLKKHRKEDAARRWGKGR